MKEASRIARKAIFLTGLVLSVAYFVPFVLVFINAFKPKYDILENPLAWPKTITMDNFTQALEKMDFYRSLTNSIIITVFSVSGLIIFSSMLAYYLARNKNPGKGLRDRRGQVLFIDARKLGVLVDRTRRELTDEEVQKIADTYHAWRGEEGAGEYADVAGFCKSASMDNIRKHGHVLTPGRYVGTGDLVKDDESFEERMTRLATELGEQLVESAGLQATMREQLKLIGFPIVELEQ